MQFLPVRLQQIKARGAQRTGKTEKIQKKLVLRGIHGTARTLGLSFFSFPAPTPFKISLECLRLAGRSDLEFSAQHSIF